jgi:maleylpyruvate isomerase
VRSATGRAIPAAEVPWLRAREVWLHAIDLDVGVMPENLPDDFVEALLTDLSGWLNSQPLPALRLVSDGSGRELQRGAGPTQLVRGPSAQLAAWLTGRADGSKLISSAPLPVLPPWL